MRVTGGPVVVDALSTVSKGLELEELGIIRIRDHPGHSIVKIDKNTQESLVDERKLAVTQTPVNNHHLNLVWRTHKLWNNKSAAK